MTAIVSLSLPEPVAAALEARAAVVGQTVSEWVSDRLMEAYSTGYIAPASPKPRRRRLRTARALRRHAERLLARADAKDAAVVALLDHEAIA